MVQEAQKYNMLLVTIVFRIENFITICPDYNILWRHKSSKSPKQK
jgi:hypothetical protein